MSCFADEGEGLTPLAISLKEVVGRQVAAYSKGDIKAFVNTFAANVKTYGKGDELQISGIKAVEKAYAGYFEAHPDLHAEVAEEIIQGNFVIYKELVSDAVDAKNFLRPQYMKLGIIKFRISGSFNNPRYSNALW
ncbi:nuclear transport factor 2 family protein [uncultured Gilvimarinus sp.]|uniref:nuclear transport factor 2 family protein n=1 Tax=uncultured Gilvimarinus sp. TaxID=1689143 RepID=UPI0030DC7B5C